MGAFSIWKQFKNFVVLLDLNHQSYLGKLLILTEVIRFQ